MGWAAMTSHARRQAIYATIWRWHFYAGLFVIPFVLLLAVTGAAYLFKPQVERWEERAFQNLPTERTIGPQAQLDAARSEEHTSELQSLMRNRSAVHCLKQKQHHRTDADHPRHN